MITIDIQKMRRSVVRNFFFEFNGALADVLCLNKDGECGDFDDCGASNRFIGRILDAR